MRFFLLFSYLLATHFVTFAQEMGNARYGRSQSQSSGNVADAQVYEDGDIELKIRGVLNVLPNHYVAVFNVLQIGPTQIETERLMRERLLVFTRSLHTAGFDTTTFRIDVISLVPRYETAVEKRLFSKRYNEVPAGFELQKTISIPYINGGSTNKILAVAGQAEIYDLVKVDCSVPDVKKAEEELRTACLAAFKAKEQAYLTAGFRLDTMPKTFAENATTIYPSSRYQNYQAASRPSFDALRRGLLGMEKVTVTQAAQTTVYYYAPVPYDQYDVVLNPVVSQPVVQFTYSFTARYQSRPRMKNKYYFLDANGNAKPIQVE